MFANGRIWIAYLIVFVSSTCTMTIELVAGRIMAPYIGVSLYTWTSIIGIVLAGMSLGNYLGGVVADRRASRGILGLIFIAGGLASLGILVMTGLAMAIQIQMSLIPKIVVFTTAIFFLPSLVLGMVSPIVVKLALADIKRTGNTVGSIYAFSTVGSIFGTFITGFWLISWMGTRSIVWAVGLVLLAMGFLIGEYWRPKGRLAALIGTLLACGAALWVNNVDSLRWYPVESMASLPEFTGATILSLTVLLLVGGLFVPAVRGAASAIAVVGFSLVYLGWSPGLYRAPCEVESNYFCIRTSETTIDGHKVRALVLDHLIHSYVSLDDPKVLGYGYERVYAELTSFYTQEHPQNGLDTLFIGGGGYTFPRYLEAVYPNSTIDVMEIDPAVTEAAHDYLNLPRDTRIRSFNYDARTFLMEWKDPKKYDAVYGDAFNDLSVPYHLTTVEFDRMIADRLKPEGIYVINVIDKFRDGEFMKAFVASLREVFPNVYVMSQGEAWKGNGANTYVVVASREPFDYSRFEQVVGVNGSVRTSLLPADELEAYLSSGRKIVLTDDYVPVDQLVARLFLDRGF